MTRGFKFISKLKVFSYLNLVSIISIIIVVIFFLVVYLNPSGLEQVSSRIKLLNTKFINRSIDNLFFKNNLAESHIIELTKDGYKPKDVSVSVGETVVFKSTTGKTHWPASNLHPTHDIYSEFDPKEPIEADKTWSFKFDKVGVWKFHDHLAPSFRGSVIVVESKNNKASLDIKAVVQDCSKFGPSEKQSCWTDNLESVIENKGLDAAFDYFIELYQTEPELPKGCHGWGHILGEEAYQLYLGKKDFVLRKEVAYCGYGFFHGFLEKLITTSNDINQAKEFCINTTKSPGYLSGMYDNCIHGIGHGTAASLVENPQYGGKFEQAANDGLKVCDSLFVDRNDLVNCYDGIFNELQSALAYSENNFSFQDFNKKNDPFYYCRKLEHKYQGSCYFEFIGLFDILFKDNLFDATNFVINNVQDLEYARKSIAKLAADFMQDDITNSDHSRNVRACRLVPKELSEVCLGGIINGFFAHGEPNKEYIKALDFCKENILTKDEQYTCYKLLLGQSQYTYTNSKYSEICDLVDKKFKINSCND